MLREMLGSSDSYFTAISKEGGQITRLGLLAKLELGRLGTPDAQAFADQLDQMVAGIQGGIKDTRQAYSDMENSIERVIIGGGQVLEAAHNHLTEMVRAIDQSSEELAILQKLIRDSIEALVHGFKELRKSLAAVQQSLASHRQLVEMVRKTETCLKQCLERLAASNVVDEGVSLSNEQLAELMEHFTSYVERQVTQELFSHEEIDIGSQGWGAGAVLAGGSKWRSDCPVILLSTALKKSCRNSRKACRERSRSSWMHRGFVTWTGAPFSSFCRPSSPLRKKARS